jgi:hypothetical protein
MKIILHLKFFYRIFRYFLSSTKRYSFLLLSIYRQRPKSIIEIGVYNGNRAVELIETAKIFNNDIKYYGFDLFEDFYNSKNIINKELSKFPLSKKKIEKKLEKYSNINLLKGNTIKTLPKFIKKNKNVDFVFIDGGHSVSTIQSDWRSIKKIISKKSLVIFDDYYEIKKSIFNRYGCNKIINSLNRRVYKYKKFFLGDNFYDKFLNSRKKIYMVSVKKI